MPASLQRVCLRRFLTESSGSDLVEPLRSSLAQGDVVAIPTESSYGLAALPDSRRGVEKIIEIKGRDDRKPLPVVVADADQAAALGVDLEHPLWQWATSRWPAPLTVVVPTRRGLAAQRGAAGLGLRIPELDDLRRLLAVLETGLTATSANASGSTSLLQPSAVVDLFAGHGGWLLDAGDLPGGAPSTVVAWNADQRAPVVLRQGAYVV